MITPLQVTYTRARGDTIQVGPVAVTADDTAFVWTGATVTGTLREKVDGAAMFTFTGTCTPTANVLRVAGVITPAQSGGLAAKNYFGDLEVNHSGTILTPLRFVLSILAA